MEHTRGRLLLVSVTTNKRVKRRSAQHSVLLESFLQSCLFLTNPRIHLVVQILLNLCKHQPPRKVETVPKWRCWTTIYRRLLLTQWLFSRIGVALSLLVICVEIPIEAHVFCIFQHVTAMKFPLNNSKGLSISFLYARNRDFGQKTILQQLL